MNLAYPITIPPASVGQAFGGHLMDYSQFGLVGHNGQDFPAPKGTKVYAVHDGFVMNVPNDVKGYGNYIRQSWKEAGFDWDVVYGHLDRFEGIDRPVKTGELIGYVDSTGFSTGHHLHFGIRKLLNGQVVDYNNGYKGYLDPLLFLERELMIEFVRKTGTLEYGLLVTSSVGVFYVPASTEADLKARGGLIVPLTPNGAVDFTKARDIIL